MQCPVAANTGPDLHEDGDLDARARGSLRPAGAGETAPAADGRLPPRLLQGGAGGVRRQGAASRRCRPRALVRGLISETDEQGRQKQGRRIFVFCCCQFMFKVWKVYHYCVCVPTCVYVFVETCLNMPTLFLPTPFR